MRTYQTRLEVDFQADNKFRISVYSYRGMMLFSFCGPLDKGVENLLLYLGGYLQGDFLDEVEKDCEER